MTQSHFKEIKMNQCKVCGLAFSLESFYSSIKTYCKTHWKQKVKANRDSNSEYYRAYDRERAKQPDRIDVAKQIYSRWKLQNPERRAAQVRLSNAVRDGRVLKWPVCELPECNLKPEAHHPNYSAPLSVVWLCPAHHKQAHALAGRLTGKFEGIAA